VQAKLDVSSVMFGDSRSTKFHHPRMQHDTRWFPLPFDCPLNKTILGLIHKSSGFDDW
jgi:hypothetical protein